MTTTVDVARQTNEQKIVQIRGKFAGDGCLEEHELRAALKASMEESGMIFDSQGIYIM